jgi:hypothetical protein
MAVKVKLLTSRVGANGAENRGDVIEVGAGEASRMIAAGQAVPVQSEKREKQTKRMKGVEKRA